VFDLVSPFGDIQDVELGVPVAINIENGIAAMALAQISGVTADEIRRGMKTFGGVDRRFDFKLKTPTKVYLSDYAHHPEEIRQSILSMRALYADKKLTGIFQPHLYTRTRDFYREFAESLSLLDEVILTEIYPARELPIEGVTSQLIYDHLRPGIERSIIRKSDVLQVVERKAKDLEVLITLGAGDLEDYSGRIAEILKREVNNPE
jgi:UDP-N-acetylmuramate--alanine ligase